MQPVFKSINSSFISKIDISISISEFDIIPPNGKYQSCGNNNATENVENIKKICVHQPYLEKVKIF
jgi:hypothetical protein